MPLWPVIAGAVILMVVWTLIPGVRHLRYRRAIRERTSAREAWAEQFPNAMPSVEQALTIVCDAFQFDRQSRFQFRPEDRVIDIYRGTTGPVSDEMQLETLTVKMRQAFDGDLLNTLDEDTTLRDLVALALEHRTELGKRP